MPSFSTVRDLLVLPIAALALAAPAQAAWQPPQVLSRAERSIDGLQFAAGRDGRVLLSWRFFSRSRAGGAVASRGVGGAWGRQRTIGLSTTALDGRRRVTGAGSGLSSIAGFGAGGVVALSSHDVAPRSVLDVWTGRTTGELRRGGTLPEPPWDPATVAAFPDGAAVAAWTTMRPRRGAGTNLRPRVAVVAARTRPDASFGRPRRISPQPPAPPYGNGLGPKLSATALVVAVGGPRMVIAAWQRSGLVEARVSRDRGRTWGPVRRLGPSEQHPRIGIAISPRGRGVVAWTTRERLGRQRALVTRLARATGLGRFATRVLERTAPLAAIPAPVADQFGPVALARFADEVPVVAWQGADDTGIVVRSAFLRSAGEVRATHAAPDGSTTTVLDDLVSPASIGSAALGIRSVAADSRPLHGYVLRAIPGGDFGAVTQLPLTAVSSLRLIGARDGWLAAAVTRRPDGDVVLATVNRE